jgi:hypothetical protein
MKLVKVSTLARLKKTGKNIKKHSIELKVLPGENICSNRLFTRVRMHFCGMNLTPMFMNLQFRSRAKM